MTSEYGNDVPDPIETPNPCNIADCACRAFVPHDQNFMFCRECKHKKTEHGMDESDQSDLG
jgi:hypothetical protein